MAQSKVDAALSFQTSQRKSREDLSRANGDESLGSRLSSSRMLVKVGDGQTTRWFDLVGLVPIQRRPRHCRKSRGTTQTRCGGYDASLACRCNVSAVRLVVLDEADRLLDATDVQQQRKQANNDKDSDSEEEEETTTTQQSGSFQTKTFLSQMDSILSGIPPTAVRALFSATVTPMVRSLAESILRNPVDLTVSSHSKAGGVGGANGDIDQELRFVGREEGKLLALRQMKARGELRPPALVFLQSQERAQARCCTTGCTWM